jgi:hypothetical protein
LIVIGSLAWSYSRMLPRHFVFLFVRGDRSILSR